MGEEQPKGWMQAVASMLAAWIVKQEYVNVLLLLILFALLYFMYWAMNVGVPMHLKQIQAGYDRMEERHAQLVERIERTHDAQLKYVVDSFREMQRQGQYSRFGTPPPATNTP